MAVNCRGCGSVLEPSEEQVNSTVDQVLQSSLEDAHQTGGVCPLCGHSKDVPYTRRPPVLFMLLMACLIVAAILAVDFESLKTKRQNIAVSDALGRMNAEPNLLDVLGHPITAGSGVDYKVNQDETGWQEARLTIPVHGLQGDGVAHVAEGRMDNGPWTFSTFEVIVEKQHKKVDLLSGRVVQYDTDAYADVHMQAAVPAEVMELSAPAPHLDAAYPCVSGVVGGASVVAAQMGSCALAPEAGAPVDRFEADLRYGRFVMRQTDLYLNDVFQVPLTRTYASFGWGNQNPVQAFGRNTGHPYDIDPLGSRNPYTFQMIAFEDGDFVYFPRISKGTGYADALYQHSESSTRFYKALQRWNGRGWTLTLADGSAIEFPESYNSKNMAQGAPMEMRNAHGDDLELIRDGPRNLQEVLTPHGHWIKFQYDNLSRVRYAATDAGQWAKYEYTPNGMLTSAVLSSGKERHYTYDGHLMLTVTDERGQTLVRNTYTQNVLAGQTFANGQTYSYSYTWAANNMYVEVAHVTMPDGSVKDIPMAGFVSDYLKQPRR